jgi:hypothetical protein
VDHLLVDAIHGGDAVEAQRLLQAVAMDYVIDIGSPDGGPHVRGHPPDCNSATSGDLFRGLACHAPGGHAAASTPHKTLGRSPTRS